MIDILDAFEQAWHRYRCWLDRPERCQPDCPARPDIRAHLAACPAADRADVCRELVFIDLEHTVKLLPRWRPVVLPAFLARRAHVLGHPGSLAPHYFTEFQDYLGPLDLLGLERWEYQYYLRCDPQEILEYYLHRSTPPDMGFTLPELKEIDAYPPWDDGPRNAQELRGWLLDALYLDASDWDWACALAHKGDYPRGLLRTLQTKEASWAEGLAASVTALSAFQVDMLLEGASARLWRGPFLLLRSIGSGGMGAVFLARDPGLNRLVAIKIIRSDQVTPDFEQRFREEARRLARLKHEHIATVHYFPPARQGMFMAMELVGGPGSPLGQDGEPVSIDQVVVWLVQILKALAYAHGKGIVHRDLKPQNLIVDEHNNVVIVDFGLSAALQSAEDRKHAAVSPIGWRRVYAASWPWLWPLLSFAPPGSPVWEPLECELAEGLKHFEGSVPYAAPEQWVHPTALGPAVDIYPLGLIVVELLVGQPLFGDSQEPLPTKVARRIVRVAPGAKEQGRHARLQAEHVFMEPPVPKALKAVTMPRGLVTIIRAMLTKHPKHRPSADQLVRVLEPYLLRGGLLILVLFVWGLAAALGAGGLTVLWMQAIGGSDEPHGLAAAVWAILSTAAVLTVAAWVRCRYELQSMRQQLPACLFMLVAVTVGATWFYSVRVGDALGLRQWFEHQAPFGFVGREMCLAVIWASMNSLPGFALLNLLLRVPERAAWGFAVTASLVVLGGGVMPPWWGEGLIGGLSALFLLWRCLCGLRGHVRWSFPLWSGPFLVVVAVVGVVFPFLLLLGDQPRAEWVRGVLAGVALRLGLFFGFLLVSRRVPWCSVDRVQPAIRSVTQRDDSTGRH